MLAYFELCMSGLPDMTAAEVEKDLAFILKLAFPNTNIDIQTAEVAPEHEQTPPKPRTEPSVPTEAEDRTPPVGPAGYTTRIWQPGSPPESAGEMEGLDRT